MADQQLKVWAEELIIDGVTQTNQRRDIEDEEFNDGFLLNQDVSSQVINQMFRLLSVYSSPFSNAPVLYPSALPIPTEALEMDGQTITETLYPNAFSIYGSTLPDIVSSAPTGFTYIIRKS